MSAFPNIQLARIVRAHSYAAGAWRTTVPMYDVDINHDRGRHRLRQDPRLFLQLTLEEQAFVTARITWRAYKARLDRERPVANNPQLTPGGAK